jgi:GNAT superfamily N-acetyltransferase
MELSPEDHPMLRPLFSDFGLRLHGLIEAVCSRDFGRAWVDDPVSPSVAVSHIDFWLIGGEPGAPAAAEAVRMVTRGTIVTAGGAWDDVVRETLGAAAQERTRTGFATSHRHEWDRARLREMAASLPEGFAIRRITASNLATFLDVAKDFASNWRSHEAFLAGGVGFGVFEGDRCVAGCGSFTLANNRLEVEIDTEPAYRRRGLARAVAAALILHCLEAGIEPCWDAHNPESAALAQQLGFVEPYPYTVFAVG